MLENAIFCDCCATRFDVIYPGEGKSSIRLNVVNHSLEDAPISNLKKRDSSLSHKNNIICIARIANSEYFKA